MRRHGKSTIISENGWKNNICKISWKRICAIKIGNEIKDDAKIIGTTPPGQSLIGIVFVDTPLNVLFPCNFPEYVTGIFFSVSCSHTVNMNNAVIKIKRKNK